MCTARRILAEFRRDWAEGISKDNHFIIDNHYEIYQNLQNKIYPDELNVYVINETYKKHILVTLDFTNLNTYPFKPPKVKINNKYDYIGFLATIPYKIVQNELKLKCLCCNSILCKWGPNYSILKIIEECNNNIDMKLRSANKKIAELCVIKKFGHYLPIAEFL